MKAQEIIRAVLDMLDQANQDPGNDQSPLTDVPQDDPNRIKQIADLLSGYDAREYANEPQEEYAGIDSVTINAGGGVNGPKHPHDIRLKDPSAYPNQQD